MRDAVLARAAVLDAQARALVDLVSVIPAEAELWLLEQASESGLDALERCVTAGMLEAQGAAPCAFVTSWRGSWSSSTWVLPELSIFGRT